MPKAIFVVPKMLPLDVNAEAFINLGKETSILPADLSRIAHDWAGRVRDRVRNNTTVTAKDLCALQWSWPAFDAMVEDLLAEDLWPTPWHHYENKIKGGTDLAVVKAKIFVQTVGTVAASLTKSRDFEFKLEAREQGCHLYTDSEIGAHFIQKRLGSHPSVADLKTWPPIYPGDQSHLKIGLSGLHSRKGKFFGIGVERPFWA